MKDFKIFVPKLLLLGFLLSFILTNLSAQDASQLPTYKNINKTTEQRVKDLLSRMTLDEKIDMLRGVGTKRVAPDSHAKTDSPNEIIQALDFQSRTKENIRLDIPQLIMTDGPLGPKGKGYSTNYSATINFAATFDKSLVKQIGISMGAETRNLGFNTLLAPCINIARTPFNGRSFEAFGEDPYLTSILGVEFIKGIQSQNVVSCAKHYIANNQEWNRMSVDVNLSERALHEIYLPAFKAAVKEADVWTVMSSYNKVYGQYLAENKYLLNDILKEKLGFTGAVISDWGGTHNTLPTLLSGLDLEMPIGKVMDYESVLAEIKKGTVSVSIIDDKVARLLRVMFKAGLFDESVASYGGQTNTEYRRKLALEVAEKSIVLLKNEANLLPVKKENHNKIAIIGPYGNIARMTGSGSADNPGHYAISIQDGVKKLYGECSNIKFERGIAVSKMDLSVLPSSLLLLPKEKGDEPGVWAEYFNNRDLKGEPALSRKEQQLNFDWGYGSPRDNKGGSPNPKVVKTDEWSARWTGRLISPGDGWYDIGLKADNGVRMYLNEQLVINSWTAQIPGQYNITQFEFKKDEIYDLKVEFYENWGSCRCILGMEEFKPGPVSQKAVELAKNSDLVIMGLGLSIDQEGEGTDKASLKLPQAQVDLIKNVAKVNKNIVAVLYGGNPVLINDWANDIPVIIEAFYPGQEGGNALANIIFGNVNPSGKLPITFPKKWEDSPAYGTYPGLRDSANYTEGIFVGYRGFDKKNIEPLYEFGYGLSYTTFEYSDLKLSSTKVTQNDTLEISVTIKNSGKMDGDEVVQLYISDKKASVEREVKSLKGFARVSLKVGESKTVSFKITKKDLAFYDVKNKTWKVEKGKFNVLIGASSRDIKLIKTFTLK